MVGDELAEKFVGILFHAGEQLTTSALRSALRTSLKVGTMPVKGIWKMAKTGVKAGSHQVHEAVTSKNINIEKLSDRGPVQSVPVAKDEMAGFDKHAKRHGLEYSLVRSVHDPTHYTLYFRKSDLGKFQAATEDFIADKDLNKSGFAERLRNAQDVARKRNEARAQERSQTKDKEKTKGRQPKVRADR